MITDLEIRNFKGIDDLNQSFNGGVFLVTGENEVGKSSFIQAIFAMLTGDRGNNLLQEGKEKGFVRGKFEHNGEIYTITITFTEKDPHGKLKIESENGTVTSSAKGVLQNIFQYQNFDAAEFISWSNTAAGRRKQVEIVKSLFPESEIKKLQEIDLDVERKKKKRQDIGSEARAYETIVKKGLLAADFIDKYKEPIDPEAARQKVNEIQQYNANRLPVENEISRTEQKLNNWEQTKADSLRIYEEEHKEADEKIYKLDQDSSIKTRENLEIKQKIKQLEQQIQENENAILRNGAEIKGITRSKTDIDERKEDKSKRLEARKLEVEAELVDKKQWLIDNPVKPLDEVNKEVEEVAVHNMNNQQVIKHLEDIKNADKTRNEYQTISQEIEDLISAKKLIIASNKLPVDGLSFDSDQLYLNDIPFVDGEVSTSQIMDVSVKLLMAKNPTCKMFYITRGESLGAEKFKSIISFAKENGYQGFIEEVVRTQDNLQVFEYVEK